MINVTKEWNPKQALLKDIINKPNRFSEAKDLLIQMHSLVHTSEVTGTTANTYEDLLWDSLVFEECKIIPGKSNITIAWDIWHLTRIEDLVSNILIKDTAQVINSNDWINKMNVKVLDTGNEMTTDEVRSFSDDIDINELRNYRIAVGRKTQQIIKHLNSGDITKKVNKSGLDRIYEEGGVLDESRYLLDFWGRKNIAGILLMPITRHQIVHLNEALKIKNQIKKMIK